MPHLISGDDRCVLQSGTFTLGGRGSNALPVGALSWHPAAATITVHGDGPVLLKRTTAAVVVRCNGESLGVAPVELKHGTRIDFEGCRLVYEADSPRGEAPFDAGRVARTQSPLRIAAASAGAATENAAARLVNVRTGAALRLTGRRVVIGRDEACDLVLADMGVSRRHASISPVRGGYLLRDESANGTVVNGTRVAGTYLLDHGDILLIHQEELRFEVHGAAQGGRPVAAREGDAAPTAILDLSHVTGEPSGASRARAAVPTASLEIVRGQFAGASFQVGRAVCAIGRAAESDVRIRDETVSSAHATLLRKGASWYVVDLRSANGTFVDGSRVAGEREIRSGAALRLGAVELVFRSHDDATGAARDESPGRKKGWMRRLLRREG